MWIFKSELLIHSNLQNLPVQYFIHSVGSAVCDLVQFCFDYRKRLGLSHCSPSALLLSVSFCPSNKIEKMASRSSGFVVPALGPIDIPGGPPKNNLNCEQFGIYEKG